jgi:hypothetical protein
MKWRVWFSCQGGPLFDGVDAEDENEAIEKAEDLLDEMPAEDIIQSLAEIELCGCEEEGDEEASNDVGLVPAEEAPASADAIRTESDGQEQAVAAQADDDGDCGRTTAREDDHRALYQIEAQWELEAADETKARTQAAHRVEDIAPDSWYITEAADAGRYRP